MISKIVVSGFNLNYIKVKQTEHDVLPCSVFFIVSRHILNTDTAPQNAAFFVRLYAIGVVPEMRLKVFVK